MNENLENKVQEQDQEMVDVNKLNDDYLQYPHKEEYPKLYFVDMEEQGVYVE
jgi:hypothetical protein